MKKVPYLSTTDIENRIEDLLTATGMMPTLENPILDLESLIQGPLQAVLDEYAELPSDIMGEVVFEPGCRDHVKINRDLSELADSGATETAATAQARRRSTTAHEAGHVIFHRDILMPVADQGALSLFATTAEPSPNPPTSHAYRCLKSSFGRLNVGMAQRPAMRTSGAYASRDVDFMEIQANKAMAALLLPRAIFCATATEPLRRWEAQRNILDDRAHFSELYGIIRKLSAQFEVSRQVVEIRIKMLNLLAESKTADMFQTP